MADLIRLIDLDFHENWYAQVFGVADFKYDIRSSKNKMADPTWQT